MPPWPWTIALGRPVVPELNSTYSGWSAATAVNAGDVDPPATSSAQVVPAGGRSGRRYGTWTTWRSVGRAAAISATSAARSTSLAP